VHSQFIEAVAEGRALDITAVKAIADGRIFTGRQAKDVKLIDDLGDLNEAIRLAADMAGIEGEPRVFEPRKRFSIRDLIEGRFGNWLPRLPFETGVRLKYLMAF
jgi:protease-4